MILHRLRARLAASLGDPELAASTRGLTACIRLLVEDDAAVLVFAADGARLAEDSSTPADVTVAASSPIWETILSPRPPRGASSFTALQLVNPDVTIEGEPLVVAQARAALERVFELLRVPATAAALPVRRDAGQIRGRYAPIQAGGVAVDLFFEEAGLGPPLLCLHTAGADGRQYAALLADVELAARWRIMAFDMPFHGRSSPPLDWNGGAYRLDQRTYLGCVAAFIEQAVREPVILMGCSMGAAIALVAAAERPDLLRGVVALEPPLRSPGRRNPFLAHAQVWDGTHNAAYVRSLMSPTSPEGHRRRAAWIYSQGGPGVYAGDLAFYSDEFDGHVVGPRIDTTRTPVTLMTGEYDYSATAEDGDKLAMLVKGSRFVRMPDLGHFPMTENPDLFRAFLVPALDEIAARRHSPK